MLGFILFCADMGSAMDTKYFQEKAALCVRLADGLSLNNPARFQLMDLAEDFMKHAKQLEAQGAEQEGQSQH